MIDVMFYDVFTGVFCIPAEEDLRIAPPERFIKTYRGVDVYVETWDTDRGRLSFSYSKEDRNRGWEHVERMRGVYAEGNGCKLQFLRCWTVPADYFDEMYDRFIRGDELC